MSWKVVSFSGFRGLAIIVVSRQMFSTLLHHVWQGTFVQDTAPRFMSRQTASSFWQCTVFYTMRFSVHHQQPLWCTRFVSPVTILGKSILTSVTVENSDWIALMPDRTFHLQWPHREIIVYLFSDASTKAIAVFAYLKVTNADGNCYVNFVMGKAKLTSCPEKTVPRLELCAAVPGWSWLT